MKAQQQRAERKRKASEFRLRASDLDKRKATSQIDELREAEKEAAASELWMPPNRGRALGRSGELLLQLPVELAIV